MAAWTGAQESDNPRLNKEKDMPYTAEISRSNPTVFLFLVDQSGSMEDKVSIGAVEGAVCCRCIEQNPYKLDYPLY